MASIFSRLSAGILLANGFVETSCNRESTSRYFQVPGVQFRLRVSLHAWTAERHVEFPDVVLSWVLSEAVPSAKVPDLAAKIGKAFVDASARRYLGVEA